MRSASLLVFSVLYIRGFTKKPPIWEPTHTIEGTLYIPYAKVAEPFYAWYDNTTGRSRIDYYGGMVKTYQNSHSFDYGATFKVVPVTIDAIHVLDQDICFQVNGTEAQHIEPQSTLPDCTDFQYSGTEVMLGIRCHKFVYEENIGNKKNIYTMWVYYKKLPYHPTDKIPIPVRYEMNGLNSLLGSHYDHYYLNYESYNQEYFPDDTFVVHVDAPCIGFPGPATKQYATFNPIKEFIYPQATDHVDNEFKEFLGKHRKRYHTTQEHDQRKNIFMQNLRFINSQNRAKLGFTLAVNHLADKTSDELSALRGFRFSDKNNGGQKFPYNNTVELSSLPSQFDWRTYGAVTTVKDQAVCGACWSFSSIGVVEGAFFLKNGGSLVRLSEQGLIDCSWGYSNTGCDGGDNFGAYRWMMATGGIPTDQEYGGYLGQDGYCHSSNVSLVAPITNWVNVTSNSSDSLKIALVKNGPIAVIFDASQTSFTFYSHGIYYEPLCKNGLGELDHSVLVVGYGILKGEPYWLIKNSWSTYWGMDGYGWVSAKNNNCGILTLPTYVIM